MTHPTPGSLWIALPDRSAVMPTNPCSEFPGAPSRLGASQCQSRSTNCQGANNPRVPFQSDRSTAPPIHKLTRLPWLTQKTQSRAPEELLVPSAARLSQVVGARPVAFRPRLTAWLAFREPRPCGHPPRLCLPTSGDLLAKQRLAVSPFSPFFLSLNRYKRQSENDAPTRIKFDPSDCRARDCR